ncbi:hypothetical protein ACS0TY_022955 [Phlomoides rotata]
MLHSLARSRDVCSKPKSPRAHHCRSCGMCILDMDHHCPFIGNCVGAANHRCFILFLISAVINTLYVTIMTLYSTVHIWPPFEHTTLSQLGVLVDTEFIFGDLKDKILALLRSAVFLSVRGIVLVYLFMASVSVDIGLSVLLWQQLSYIYAGKTYLSHLRAVDSEETMGRDCQNLVRFFGMFGKRVGFLKFKADVIDKENGNKVRVPVGKLVLELPAGMLYDDNGDIVGTAVREWLKKTNRKPLLAAVEKMKEGNISIERESFF